MIEKIDSHIQDAINRLAQQYADSSNFQAILSSFNEQIQDLEDTFFNLIEGQWVDNAEGQILDDFGTIVGQDRLGFDDDFYRILIYVKMGQNVSEGEPERLIDVYKIITRANLGWIFEDFPAGLTLMSNGEINPITAQFIYEQLQQVAPAGVRIDYIGQWDDERPFAFDGFPNAKPFDDGSDDPSSGIWAYTYDTSKPFAFEDGSDKTEGFGTSDDYRVGGYWVTE